MEELVPVCKSNIGLYETFERNYNAHLQNYLSRIYPHNYDQYEDFIKRHLLIWNYIYVHQRCIGSFWLEKETPDNSSATLGIFIDDDSNRGKGVGTHVIMQSIKAGAVLLNIQRVELRVRAANTRAYNCYKNCGFQEIGRFIKNGDFEVVQMELLVN
ncbi:MAG: GNAT family protein [Ethanoligenens sp.]